MRSFRFRLGILGFLFFGHVAAASTSVTLEFPRGKFQENNPPTFFKWTSVAPATSLALKIIRKNEDGSYDIEKNLVARFDFAATTETMSWPNAPFAKGKYAWVLEAYDNKSAKPIAQETAHFEIEDLRHFDMRARRIALGVGFSRGKYKSQSNGYDLDFDITPTNYGLLIQGGNAESVWGLTGQMSDYVLRGSVRRASMASANRLSRIAGKSGFGLEAFAGPSLRVMNVPRIRASTATEVIDKSVLLVNPGLSLMLKRGLDLHTTLYAQGTLDLPVYSSAETKVDFSQLNYNLQGGFLFGLFWPIAIGGELQYKVDRSNTKDGAEDVKISTADWSILGMLVYGF